jgi:hypothetical protein
MSNNYFTVITTTNKLYFTGRGNTEKKSIDKAVELFIKNPQDNQILSMRTYDSL